MPVDLAALLLLACAKVHFPCTQESRVRPAPGIPCALSDFEGDRRCITRTDFRRGNAEARQSRQLVSSLFDCRPALRSDRGTVEMARADHVKVGPQGRREAA